METCIYKAVQNARLSMQERLISSEDCINITGMLQWVNQLVPMLARR